MSGIKIAMEIRDLLLIICFLISFMAWCIMGARGHFNNAEKLMRSLVFLTIIAVVINTYPKLILSSADIIDVSSSEVSSQIEKGIDSWANSKISGEDSWSVAGVRASIISAFYKFCIYLSGIIRNLLKIGQRIMLYCLIAFSPITLSLFLIKETSDIAVKFCMVSLGIVLWTVGFNISDMMLFSGWDIIIKSALKTPAEIAAMGGGEAAKTAIKSAAIGAALPFLTVSLALTIGFYLLVGVLFFNIFGIVIVFVLLMGGNPVSSALGTLATSNLITQSGFNVTKAGMQFGKDVVTGGNNVHDKILSTSLSKGIGNIFNKDSKL